MNFIQFDTILIMHKRHRSSNRYRPSLFCLNQFYVQLYIATKVLHEMFFNVTSCRLSIFYTFI